MSGIGKFIMYVVIVILVALAIKSLVNLPSNTWASTAAPATSVDPTTLRWWYIEESTPEEGKPSKKVTTKAKDVIASKAAVVFSVSSVNNRGENVDVFFQYMPAQCGQGKYRSSDGRREGLFVVSSVSEGIVRGWYKGTKVPSGLPSGGMITLIRDDILRK